MYGKVIYKWKNECMVSPFISMVSESGVKQHNAIRDTVFYERNWFDNTTVRILIVV